MTIMRCASVMASTWSCVTNRLVMPSSRCSFWISMRVCARSLASRFDSGSSNRNTCGWRTMARPMATRWRWPPESSRGLRSSRCDELQDLGGLVDARLDLVLGHLGDLQAVGHVVEVRHVRVQRVVLEHHRDVALGRLQVVDHAVADADVAARDFFEARDHAQQRGLAAARGADDDDEFAVGDLGVHAVDHWYGVLPLP